MSREALDLLSKAKEPMKLAERVLSMIEKNKERPMFITPEYIKSVMEVPPVAVEISSPVQPSEDWDLAKAESQRMTHGLHPYPARMLPQIAEKLIKRYLIESLPPPHDRYTVLDPFCGSGTVLVECKRLGVNSIGNDINPLAILLAKVKANPIHPVKLDEGVTSFLKSVREDIARTRSRELKVKSPNFPNIHHWFKDYVINELQTIRQNIEKINDANLRDFFKVCFSLTVMNTSNVDQHSSRFIRVLPEERLKRHKPNVLTTFNDITMDSAKRVSSFYNICSNAWVNVIEGDARKLPLRNESVDLIVTSPPYGEEKNTVAYTRWSKLSLYWLGYEQDAIKTLEKASLGRGKGSIWTPSETANKVLNEVSKYEKERALEAAPFFHDYQESIREMHRVLKKGSYCCIVIGNRSIRRIALDMEKVTVELGSTVGFKHVKTYYRNIPKKLIPWTTPTGNTIAYENIVVLSKG